MSDVLSQNEIDSLLQALNSGEVDAEEMKKEPSKAIKDYDFARPSKFSKEHLRTLENIFEHYGRLVSTHLPIYLRKNISVEVMNSEALTYFEFSNSLSNPSLLGIINYPPLDGNVIMEIATKLGYTMVDRMLGGEGLPLEKIRDFSEIELLIIERIMTSCAELLREPLLSVVDGSPRLERIETNPQFAQIISPNEMIAIITLNIKIGEIEGLMNVCLPYLTLEPVIDRLNTKFWYSNQQEKSSEDFDEEIESIISRSNIPVSAVLGKTRIHVSDFAGLQVGDVIRLNRKVEEELDIYVGSMKKFTALPGATGKNYAVRVMTIQKEEE